MRCKRPEKGGIWKKVALFILVIPGIIFIVLLSGKLFDWNTPPVEQQKTITELISTKDIATLSVSEFVYNGIAQTFKDDGTPDYNILYKSTVKVGIDADSIRYTADEESKVITFIFPEFRINNPVIDVGSISTIPSDMNLHMDEVIKLCRNDAMTEAMESGKLISSAQENLKTIMEAWYSPVFEGYTFEYQFGTAEGGEAE